MAQYFTDFSEYTTDASPSDWSGTEAGGLYRVRDVTGAVGGKALEFSIATAGQADRFFGWDGDVNSDANRDDVDVLIKFRVVSGTINMNPIGLRIETSPTYEG